MNTDAHQGDAERSRVPVHTINSAPVPDQANAQFASAIAAQIVRNVGIKLRELGQDASTVQSLANLVTAFFWRELGLECAPKLDDRSLRPDEEIAISESVKIDLDALAVALERIAIAPPTELCSASANVGALRIVLHLTSAEQKLLAWSFAAAYSDKAELLDRLACELRFNDAEQKYAVLAILIDEAVDAVRDVFESGRLLALRLVTPRSWHRASNLSDVLSATFECLWLLQTQHRSRNALMAFVLEPEFDCTLVVDSSTPSWLYRECFPEQIAAAYERTVKHELLRADDIASLLHWFAAIEVDAARVEPLAGRLAFETIRETIKQCYVERSKADVATTEFDLLRSLYNAATKLAGR